MRDVVFSLLMLALLFMAIRKPWVGALTWVWMGLMNPHRFTYGFAYDLPWSAMVAVVTMGGFLFTKDKVSPFRASWAPALVVLFTVWVTISWLNGRFPDDEWSMWTRVLKTFVMLIVIMSLLYTRTHIQLLVWVLVVSLGFLGAKGGLFTILTGGSYRVWGPLDSWVYDNNAFAVALIVIIPLMRYLQLELVNPWHRRMMAAAAILCAAAALGSQSRGGLLAILAMGLLLWWRGQNRLVGGMVMLIAGGFAGLVHAGFLGGTQ